MLQLVKMEAVLARPVSYVFCRYEIEVDDASLEASAEFVLISENQGSEHSHGRDREGVQPQTLCTDPVKMNVDGIRAHSFEIGFKPGVRLRQEYDESTKRKVQSLERDTHTKFGHIVTVPELGAMAVRDWATDDTLAAAQTLSAVKSLVRSISDGNGQISISHADEGDVDRAFERWNVHEYSFTARPLNPTGGDLAKMRTAMYQSENVWQETARLKAPPGGNLKKEDVTIGQVEELHEGGYAQRGFKGQTEDGHAASMVKPAFSQDKSKNLKMRTSRPNFLRVSFDREDKSDDVSLDVVRALVRFYE